jgi:hypothetical protein
VSHAAAVKLCRVSTTAPSAAAGSRLPDPKVRTPGTPTPEPSQVTPGGSSSGRAPFGCWASTPAVSGTQSTVDPPASHSAAGGTVQNWSVVHWCVTGWSAAMSWTASTAVVLAVERWPLASKAHTVNRPKGASSGLTRTVTDEPQTKWMPAVASPEPHDGSEAYTGAFDDGCHVQA